MNFEDYGLEGEMLEKAKADYESSLNETVEGLKNKNAELIEREKKAKEASEKLALDMATEQENAKVALAEKNNDLEQYKIAVQEREEKLKTLTFEFEETEKKRVLESTVNEFSSLVVDDPASKMYMQNLFKEGIDVKDGQVVPKNATISIDEYKNSLISDEANFKYIKANVGSGTGSAGSDGGQGSAASNENKAAIAAKEKGDGIGHLNAHFKETFNQGN